LSSPRTGIPFAPSGACVWRIADFPQKSAIRHTQDGPSNDPAHADQWGKEREVRAELIRWLCVDPRAKALVDPQGIRLLGARITGKLNLADVTVPFALTLRNCSIGERMTFEHASFPRLDLSGCYTGEIDGRAAVVHGDLNLDSVRASGEVWFNDSTVDGDLGARGGHFTHSTVEPHEPEGALFKKALDLESARIGGDVWLCYGFEADGAIDLITTTIGTSLVLSGTFNNPNNSAIIATGLAVASQVFFGSFFGKIRDWRLVLVARTRILQGSHLDITGLSKGKHLFQCCIHPWMRMEVDVK
jgi:hypothetical protein